MNAIDLIVQDHREVDELFGELEDGGGDRTALVHDVIRELSIHAAIEEQFLYPAMRRLPGGEELVEEALDEHQEAKEALSELDGMDEDEPDFDAKVRSLIQDVRHHVEEEESDLLPKLRAALSDSELEELGQRMERGKAMAPTRPHPRAPSTPPGVVVAGAVAGVVDRARDAATGRGRRKQGGTAAKKAQAKKPTAKKTTSQKPAAKKPTAKKTTAKKTTAKRPPTAKKSTAKKSTAKKTTARKAQGRGPRARGPVYHVTPDRGGGWRAVKAGSSRAVARGDSKGDVVRRARATAKGQSGRLVIHKADGTIQEERTYGPDPRRSRG